MGPRKPMKKAAAHSPIPTVVAVVNNNINNDSMHLDNININDNNIHPINDNLVNVTSSNNNATITHVDTVNINNSNNVSSTIATVPSIVPTIELIVAQVNLDNTTTPTKTTTM